VPLLLEQVNLCKRALTGRRHHDETQSRSVDARCISTTLAIAAEVPSSTG
jgi:hypothetical protein